ncbi:hypothetical protein EJ07DRAFT_174296 [Lizonia empirigonia]|nr:hypothetical protein EJ07DRAFT_174296 [Lizonia empirigonia]
MNALDYLFDFAALMSTSSAMTVSPNADGMPSKRPAASQEAASISSSSHDAPMPCSFENQPLRPPHLDDDNPSMPSQEDAMAVVPRSHGSDPEQNPNDWIPAPAHLQDLALQHNKYQLQVGPRQFLQTPGSYSELICGHHPESQCHCRYLRPALNHPSVDCAPLWMQQAPQMQYSELEAQELQHVRQEDGVYEHGYEDGAFGQQHHGQDFPSHGFCGRDECMPVMSGEVWDVRQNHVDPGAWSMERPREEHGPMGASSLRY